MSTAPFDYGVMEKLLIGDKDVQEASDFERVVKTSPKGRVVRFQNRLDFTAGREPGAELPMAAEEDALERAEAFLAELTAAAGLNFTFSHIYTQRQEAGYSIFYMGLYNKTVIASNYIQFTIDGAGISQLICSLAVPGGFAEQAREICSVDEALFTLFNELPEGSGNLNNTLVLSRMELVYLTSERGGERSTAAPYYMFTTRWAEDEPGRQERHLVNAYTNTYYRWN
jgi:hypothetical protein